MSKIPSINSGIEFLNVQYFFNTGFVNIFEHLIELNEFLMVKNELIMI